MRARLRLMAPVFALLILATSISPTAASGPYTWYPRYGIDCRATSSTSVAVVWNLPWYQGNPEGLWVASYLYIEDAEGTPDSRSKWVDWGTGVYQGGYAAQVDWQYYWYNFDAHQWFETAGPATVSVFSDVGTQFWVYNLIVWGDGTSAGYWLGPVSC